MRWEREATSGKQEAGEDVRMEDGGGKRLVEAMEPAGSSCIRDGAEKRIGLLLMRGFDNICSGHEECCLC